jgi:choice-of-anchor C domain-containing protein
MNKFIVVATLVGMVFFSAASAQANLLSNGSFEQGAFDPGSYTSINSFNNTSLTGWTINTGSIDYIGTYWTPAEGSRSLDLIGTGYAGTIYQTFDTAPGNAYTVTFAMAGNPSYGLQKMDVYVYDGDATTGSLLGTKISYIFDANGKSTTDMGWIYKTFNFASGVQSQSTLFFQSSTLNDWGGPALDDVVVVTPIPSTLLLLGSGLAGLVGIARRKIKK